MHGHGHHLKGHDIRYKRHSELGFTTDHMHLESLLQKKSAHNRMRVVSLFKAPGQTSAGFVSIAHTIVSLWPPIAKGEKIMAASNSTPSIGAVMACMKHRASKPTKIASPVRHPNRQAKTAAPQRGRWD